jgi:superfamily II DNA/RNA helicase
MDRGEVCSQFLDVVPYELYPFQEEALLAWFESEGGVLVTVPTGMGKTLIAEAAIFEALHLGQRLYYTSPLIALTDQKFREFQDKAEGWGFDRDQIGLITGNRRVNPDARVRVVVAEILLNHLLGGEEQLGDVSGVVMDEFHYFNDWERGVVWELSLTLLPPHIRLMLLSATVGNPVEFVVWMREEHGRKLQLIRSEERRVPLEFVWVGDKLLTEQLPAMLSDDDAENRSPALVFCFNREECWGVAEKLKGAKLIDQAARAEIERRLAERDFTQGAGLKLKQMLIRGVGVHHAGVLPKYKEVVEELFLEKLIPFVVCTETLAAGINLPARSVVLSTLLKGKRGEKKLVMPSNAHQMFGRAGRPQFDDKGYVCVLAHEDDVKIHKWRKKYEQIDAGSKDPGLMRARKQLERKRPTRRKTEQYWSEGQFQMLIKAGPARLVSRSMIPYQVLIYLLTKEGDLRRVKDYLSKRFTAPEKLKKFQDQLDHMIGNLATFGYLTKEDSDEHVTLHDSIHELLTFRSVDSLYGAFLSRQMVRSSFEEKIQALESVLPLPPVLERKVRLPELTPGPLQTNELEPALIQSGLVTARPEGGVAAVFEDEGADYWESGEDEESPRALSVPEMLKLLFDSKLSTPEAMFVQPKWVAAGLFEFDCDFYKFVRARDLIKDEGLVLRHLLRLIILADEFMTTSDSDPDFERIGELATRVCQVVDPRYTDRFLASEQEAKRLAAV